MLFYHYMSLYKHYQYAFANPTAHNPLPCEIFIYNYSCQIKLYILHETTVSYNFKENMKGSPSNDEYSSSEILQMIQ